MQTQELINKNVEPVYSNITKIKLDPDNMKLSVLSENKELNIFTETNNGWKVKNTLYDCNDIPVSSQDGNILVDKKSNKLEIRSLLEPHYGKVVYTAKSKFPIIAFSINPAGNKIKVFSQQDKYKSNINYSTFYTNNNPLWVETDYGSSITIGLRQFITNYTKKICPIFTSDNKLTILFDTFSNFDNDYGTGREIKITTEQERRQQNNLLRPQNFNSSNSPLNSSSNYSSRRSYNSFTLGAAAASSSFGYSCSNGGGCDGGGC
jgi:hypothetical protein